jgi:hypothetical protein
MTDLLLNLEEHDIYFINGDTPITYENKVTVAQKLKIKLLTFKSEWFLDTTIGIPYFQEILKRGVSKLSIDTIFQEAILSEPEVLEITEFNSVIDVETRSYRMSFRVRTNQNEVTDYVDILLGV